MATSIENGAKLVFEDSFLQLAQQRRSKLESSVAIKHLDPKGKTHNMARMNKIELAKVDGRNPLKNYVDYELDNRMMTKRRYTATVLIDKKQDINELLKDPTSDIMQALLSAKGRVVDRVITEAAGGDVWVGAPDATPTALSASADGVLTVDATGGLTAPKIDNVIENFINNDIEMDDVSRTTLLITGKENTALMQEEKFINNDYISGRPVESGVQKKVSGFDVVLFAGSVAGGITKENPILEENAGTRTCLALAPNSVALMMELARFDVRESDRHVNSNAITIDLWVSAMRTEGARVQKITTTL